MAQKKTKQTAPPASLRPRPRAAPASSGSEERQTPSRSRLRNLRLTLEYDGSRYRGWQIQPREKTVAGVLSRFIGDVTRDRVVLMGGGRTDAGVHAEGQVANFRSRTTMPVESLTRSVNRKLPFDINILRVEDVPLDFHARHSAWCRSYRYQIALRRSAFLRPYSWWPGEALDLEMMRIGASYLVGGHDFTPFADAPGKVKEPLVEVYEASFEGKDPLLNFRITADHFLPRMVRRIVGVLVRVGRQEDVPERTRDILAGKSAVPRDSIAPPCGLILEKIEYQRP